ncbi:MAG TPA: hypothetical protein DCQ06_09275 [Myxococcales bacterium]|nr:hypothetical protein [Myxococcales bacterium]HAN31773.1 hypothetical protein [Myxococcales bacterium]
MHYDRMIKTIVVVLGLLALASCDEEQDRAGATASALAPEAQRSLEAIQAKAKAISGGQIKTKGDPPPLECEAIDLLKFKQNVGVDLVHSSPKFRKPDQCSFHSEADSLGVTVMGIVGRRNLSQSAVANSGNPWSTDDGLPVNLSSIAKIGSVSLYADFDNRIGIHIRTYIRPTRKPVTPEAAIESGTKVALALAHRFHDQLKGFKPKPKVIDVNGAIQSANARNERRHKGKDGVKIDCAALDMARVNQAAGSAVTLRKQRKPTDCEFQSTDGLRLSLATAYMSEKRGLNTSLMVSKMLPQRSEPQWEHNANYDQWSAFSQQMPMFSGATRFAQGAGFTLNLSVAGMGMAKYLKDPKKLDDFNRLGFKVLTAMRETLAPRFTK